MNVPYIEIFEYLTNEFTHLFCLLTKFVWTKLFIILIKKALLLEINLLMLVKNSGQNINWDKRVLKSQLSFI